MLLIDRSRPHGPAARFCCAVDRDKEASMHAYIRARTHARSLCLAENFASMRARRHDGFKTLDAVSIRLSTQPVYQNPSIPNRWGRAWSGRVGLIFRDSVTSQGEPELCASVIEERIRKGP